MALYCPSCIPSCNYVCPTCRSIAAKRRELEALELDREIASLRATRPVVIETVREVPVYRTRVVHSDDSVVSGLLAGAAGFAIGSLIANAFSDDEPETKRLPKKGKR